MNCSVYAASSVIEARSPMTWKPSNPFTRNVSEGSSKSACTISSGITVSSVRPDYERSKCHIRSWGKATRQPPAHQALLRQVELSGGRTPDPTWKRPSGRPSGKWTDQLRRDNNIPTATLWRQAVGWGHSTATLQSLQADFALKTTTTKVAIAYGWCGQVYKLLMPNFSRTKNTENWLIFDRVTQNQTGRENFGTHCSKKRISDKLWTFEDKARCSKLKVSFWHYL